ncbi:V-type proton ATPase subunit A1-like protein [Tanacetum coccineum]
MVKAKPSYTVRGVRKSKGKDQFQKYKVEDIDDTSESIKPKKVRRYRKKKANGLGDLSVTAAQAMLDAGANHLLDVTRINGRVPLPACMSDHLVEKIVFIGFFSREQVRTKILEICEAFGAKCYLVPEDLTKQSQITQEVLSRLSELETTLDVGIRHRNVVLHLVGFHLTLWMNIVKREKAVFDTLNMLNFDVTKKCLVGEGWCPVFAKPQEALQHETFDSNSQDRCGDWSLLKDHTSTIHLEVEISDNNNCVKVARYMIRMVFRYTSSVRPFMEICSKGYTTLGNQGIIL